MFFSCKKALLSSGVFLLNNSQSSRSWARLQKWHEGLPRLLVDPTPSETEGLMASEGLVAKLFSLYFHLLSGGLGCDFTLLGGSFTLGGLTSSLVLFRASLPNTGPMADSDAYSTNSARSAKEITPLYLFFFLKTWSLHFACKLPGSLETTACMFGAWSRTRI